MGASPNGSFALWRLRRMGASLYGEWRLRRMGAATNVNFTPTINHQPYAAGAIRRSRQPSAAGASAPRWMWKRWAWAMISGGNARRLAPVINVWHGPAALLMTLMLRSSSSSERTSSSSITGASPVNSRRRRSEEHTSELQSRPHLVCRLLLEKKKNHTHNIFSFYIKKKKNTTIQK